MKTNNHQENWEKEFDENFDMYNPIHDDGTKIPVWSGSDFENIKSFIRQLLKAHRQEIIEEIEKMEMAEYQGTKISSYFKRSGENKGKTICY